VIAGPLSTAEGSYVALTRAREHTHLYASSDQLELPESRVPAIAVLAERLARSEPDLPSIRIPLAHEQHVEREHVQLTLEFDAEGDVEAPSVKHLRVERDRLQAIADSYPRDAAGQIESLEQDVERFRTNGENWTREAERARGELAALGPLAKRGKHANELNLDIDRSERRAEDARQAERNAAARLAQINDGTDSPQRWEAEHPNAREQLQEAEQAFNDAVQREADRAIEAPGEHLARVLGERPSHDKPIERDTWDRAARVIEAYRIAYEIDPAEPSALGSRPDPYDTSWTQAREWREAAERVLDAREQLEIAAPGLGPIEERTARVQGLMPDQDRQHALDNYHGHEI
jgi:hypothetical protein